jgi:hypothetical protein
MKETSDYFKAQAWLIEARLRWWLQAIHQVNPHDERTWRRELEEFVDAMIESFPN